MAPQQRRPTASATAEDAAPLLLPSAAPPSPPRFAGAPEARPHPDLPGSRRERLAFVLGGSLTALLSLLLLLLLGGGGRRPSSSYHAAGNGGLDPDDAGRSLLLPALGSAGADAYLRSRRGRFGTLAQWGRGEEGRSRPDCCTNPASYDPDAAYYNMTEGTGYLQPWSEERRGGHFRSLLDEGRGDGGRKRLRDRADWMREKMGWDSAAGGWRNATSRNRPAPRSIAFLHVGKAGGSSLLCNLRESFRYGKVHCPGYVHGAHTKYPLAFEDDSYLSRQVTCYVHYDERLYCYDAEAFLVNVRNPVHRLASWYLYEHAANYGALMNRELFPDRPIHCGQNMLYGCYATLDDMATLGLAGDGWDGRGGGPTCAWGGICPSSSAGDGRRRRPGAPSRPATTTSGTTSGTWTISLAGGTPGGTRGRRRSLCSASSTWTRTGPRWTASWEGLGTRCPHPAPTPTRRPRSPFRSPTGP